ncbi:MAG: GreA/GreB family elongation factor [Victivallaceae bacterium]
MDYLEKFQSLIKEEQYSSFMSIWDEFCLNDVVDAEEVVKVLEMVKGSPLAAVFGQVVDTVLPLWEVVAEGPSKDNILRLILDLQVDNSKLFYDLSYNFLKEKYEREEYFQESLKLIGLREGGEFKGAISNYELLNHLKPGKFVFHLRGWGVGEVMEASFTQKRALIEFEGVFSLKEVSFESAFKTLIPLNEGHFLSRRFGDPDSLESLAKRDPVGVIIMMLKDLGIKTSSEIKNELLDLVIPEAEWSKWWQSARSKLKKDSRVIYPDNLKDPFVLRVGSCSRVERLKKEHSENLTNKEKIISVYNFLRDFPQEVKRKDCEEYLISVLEDIVSLDNCDPIDRLQCLIILNDFLSIDKESVVKEYVCSSKIEDVMDSIYVLGLKRSFLELIKKHLKEWNRVFLSLFLCNNISNIRGYLFKELKESEFGDILLREIITELPGKASCYPEAFIWVLQKLFMKEDGLFSPDDLSIRRDFLEASFVLLHFLSENVSDKDYQKKLYQFLVGKKYLLLREFIKSASVDFLRELILLSTKCPQFSQEDLSILQSLTEVVQPSLKSSKTVKNDDDIFWSTQGSYCKMREKLNSLAGKEMVENAREIEAARALGDLRENSEYKFALEKRARIQNEIKVLSEELGRARILTAVDISDSEVGIGCVVEVVDDTGGIVCYTILGPWEADPEKNILSLKSRFTEQMVGLKEQQRFSFHDKEFLIQKIFKAEI